MAGTSCDSRLNISTISDDNIIADENFENGTAWIRADVEEKIYILYNSTLGTNLPGVVIKFADACYASMCPADLQAAINPTLLLNAQALDTTLAAVQNPSTPGAPEPNPSGTSLSDSAATHKSKNICGLGNEGAIQASARAVDSAAINDRGYQPAAVLPNAAVIPMKSNIKTYGPFISQNFNTSAGGIGVEVNQDLSPWTFGSVSLMNEAGQKIAESANIGLLYSETGGVTVTGLPKYSFGQIFGVTGPNLTGVSVSFSSAGVTTTYDFRTFTPKFGGLTRAFIDKFKMIAKNRTEQLRMLRNNQITQSKISRKIAKFNRGNRTQTERDLPPSSRSTLQRVIIGGIENSTSGVDRNVVGLSPLGKSVIEMIEGYAQKAYMSFDALYSPVSLKGDGGLPKFADFTTLDNHKSSPNYAQPPFSISGVDNYNLEINQDYLNPLTNTFSSGEHHHDGSGYGHSIDLVGRGTELPESGLITNFYSKDDPSRYSEDYRFLALRGPLVLQSWGYDTDGKPIPNESGYTDRFAKDWLLESSKWPVGPIDLRFDRTRGVWVSPPPYRVVVAKLLDNLKPYSSTSGVLINENIEKDLQYGLELYDQNGDQVMADAANSVAQITLADRLGSLYYKDTLVYAYYDTYSTKYLILNSASNSKNIVKGTYVGSWEKGTTKLVNLTLEGTTEILAVTGINNLKDIEPELTTSESNVCYIVNLSGTIYDLIAAECL